VAPATARAEGIPLAELRFYQWSEEAELTKRMDGCDLTIGRVAAAALCAAAIGYLATGGAGAATVRHGGSSVNTFLVTGAGKGTLHAGPYAGCLNNLVKQNGLTEVNDLVGTISGFSKGIVSWSLNVNEKKTGTFTITGSLITEPTVELAPTPKSFNDYGAIVPKDTFWAKSGTVTVGAETGSIKASMADQVGQKIEISGSWACKA
jgi:hypothetical protein